MSGTLKLNDTTFATETNGNITTNVSELKINDQTVIDSNKSLNVSDVKVGGNTVIDSSGNLISGTISSSTLDGIKLKSSGASITKSDGTTAVLSESGGVVTINGTFNGTLGSNCDSSFLRINDNFKIKRYFNATSVPNTTWTTLVDVDDVIENYSHSFDFGGDRFIATTHVFGLNPGSGIVSWGVEAQNNTGFADKIVWHSASGYDVSFRTVYNSSTSIVLQIYNSTGYGPWLFQTITEFWYYTY